ncbi:hypothetical protein FDC45_14875 [Clostridium botulinum]|uniref:Uncharacterized protein n=1 Tax=Clostridium botulinum TaxID=1491 RepID=A0A846J8Q3_CLOBO|nr:hypothetical protein [Clostridium botulinum]NFJ10486.1 hypothetical protein [Clostridium botulinum]NFK16955.1 hypothetical protein [Clostridium botulinum]NFM95663.1 hypothetical protein [Clostridium botulinum]NFO18597.1 hypothetical protein [Clostridium botulinum]
MEFAIKCVELMTPTNSSFILLFVGVFFFGLTSRLFSQLTHKKLYILWAYWYLYFSKDRYK